MKEEKRLYIVRFRARSGSETFIKIGVSAFEVDQRFAADLRWFSIEKLYGSSSYRSSDAFIVEGNLHQILVAHRYEPKLRLKSGNTECFVDSGDVIDKILSVFTRKRSTSAPAKKKISGLNARQIWARHRLNEADEALAKRWDTARTISGRKKGERRPGWGAPMYKQFG